jgi:glycosyltransferase involved in cell wall biosynthesis
MNQIDIVIPTRNRLEKLKRTLSSIPGNIYGMVLNIHIVCDGDRKTYEWLKLKRRRNNIVFIPGHNGSVYCRNHIIPGCPDGVLCATDDIIFKEGAILKAWRSFNQMFKDEDGVIGFHQEGNNYHPAGVTLVGKKFLERYPEKKLFFPEYFHFCCQEVYWLASKYNKFYLEKDAIIYHYHPANHKDEMDQTHADARLYKQRDMKLINERQRKGLIWGG